MVGRHVPVCGGDAARGRGYNATQCHAALCWCVDVNGQPIDESLSHGDPRCEVNSEAIFSSVSVSLLLSFDLPTEICQREGYLRRIGEVSKYVRSFSNVPQLPDR